MAAETFPNFMGDMGREFEHRLPALVLYRDGLLIVGGYRRGNSLRRPPVVMYEAILSPQKQRELVRLVMAEHRFHEADEHYTWAWVTDFDTHAITVKIGETPKTVSVYGYADDFQPEENTDPWLLHHFPPIFAALWRFSRTGMRRYRPHGFRFLAFADRYRIAEQDASDPGLTWSGDLPFDIQEDQWHRFGEQSVMGQRGRTLARWVCTLPEGTAINVGGEKLSIYVRALLPHERG